MIKQLFICITFISTIGVNAQELNLGLKLQKSHSFYWENGLTAQYSFENFKPGKFFVGIDLVSSRFGTAFNSNALKQSSLLLSAAWYCRSEKQLHLTSKLNIGYFNVNLEEAIFADLPHSAMLLSPEFGLSYDIENFPLRLNLSTGYNVGLQPEGESPGTLQSLFYNLSFYYRIY